MEKVITMLQMTHYLQRSPSSVRRIIIESKLPYFKIRTEESGWIQTIAMTKENFLELLKFRQKKGYPIDMSTLKDHLFIDWNFSE